MKKWTLGQVGKTNPKRTQFKPKTNPIQTQFQRQKNAALQILFVFPGLGAPGLSALAAFGTQDLQY